MILIFGRNGQLSRALQEQPWNEEVLVIGSEEINFAKPDSLLTSLDRFLVSKPRLVINAAAYTSVEKAESESELALTINATSVGIVARWCATHKIPLLHFSTDYVYPGDGEKQWTEVDLTGPRNSYGSSKLAGEKAILNSGAHAYILRISWVVSPFGNNFVKTMLRLGEERTTLKVVADQFGSPMSALEVATLSHRAFFEGSSKATPGVYNLSSAPFVSWFEFALEIFACARRLGYELKVQEVIPVASADFPSCATRPLNSRMCDHKFQEEFGFGLGDWREGLPEILRRLR